LHSPQTKKGLDELLDRPKGVLKADLTETRRGRSSAATLYFGVLTVHLLG